MCHRWGWVVRHFVCLLGFSQGSSFRLRRYCQRTESASVWKVSIFADGCRTSGRRADSALRKGDHLVEAALVRMGQMIVMKSGWSTYRANIRALLLLTLQGACYAPTVSSDIISGRCWNCKRYKLHRPSS